MNYENQIATELDIHPKQVSSAIQLLDDGNTIPFIARYRKEMTLSLDELQLRKIEEKVKYLRAVDDRRRIIIESIRSQQRMTPELFQQLEMVGTLVQLEDLYQPYKPKRKSRASKAIDGGLEPLTQRIIQQPDLDIQIEVKRYISETFPSYDTVLSGARDIVAQIIADDAEIRNKVREKALEWGVLHCNKVKSAEDQNDVYRLYYEFESRVKWLKPHQTLAINRGETEKKLRVKIEIADRDWMDTISKKYLKRKSRQISLWTEQLLLAIEDSGKRLLLPSIERDVRRYLTNLAHEHAIDVFVENVRRLLLQPPLVGHVILGIDPGFRSGCKVAIVDKTGGVLETVTIYPNPPQSQYDQALYSLKQLIDRHNASLITIGNGTASRETEQLVAELVSQGSSLHYLIVNEAGASVYSASELARTELPDLDVTLRGAVSIARRVQDPLAELVKIDPKSIGVGLYQHDVDQNQLEEALAWVVQSVVNYVGVDLNTASIALLKHVSGVTDRIAQNVIDYRNVHGKFNNRDHLRQITGIGTKTYEQAAGFLRIRDGQNWLDNSAIHPESYDVAIELAKRANLGEDDSIEQRRNSIEKLLLATSVDSLSKQLNVGMLTIEDILEQLQRPGRDPREDVPLPILRSDILTMADLKEGLILHGTVRNVVDFGAFVDIGVKQDGLLHKSKIPKYIDIRVGDIVNVEIVSIDTDRGRIALSLE